jgi:hypothetical protein
MRIIHHSDAEFLAAAPEHFLFLTQSLNVFVQDKCLRQYQLAIYETGQFRIFDPFNPSQICVCDGTIYTGVKAFAWHFKTSGGSYWLLSSACGLGYEIVGALMPDQDTVLKVTDELDYTTIKEQVEKILSCQDRWAEKAPLPAPQSFLVAGHPNFAHYIWNELPALLILESYVPKISGVKVTNEPIAQFSSLVQLLDAPKIDCIAARILYEDPRQFHPDLLFAVGSKLVTKTVKERLKSVLLTPPSQDDNRFKIWVSIRLLYRHPINQSEFIALFIAKIAERGIPATIILDGYSLSNDVDMKGRLYPELERQRATDVQSYSENLISSLPLAVRQCVFIVNTSNLVLPDAIRWAGLANFYVCHHGTQQHKIGWIYDVPGVVHAAPSILQTYPANWVKSQSEGSVLPVYTPTDLIKQVSQTEGRRPGYDDDYEFISCQSMVDFVLQEMMPVWETYRTF